MALDVANIVPLEVGSEEQNNPLCDINGPIELSTDEQEVEDLPLSVPDSQYFSKIFKEDREQVKQAYRDLIEGRAEKSEKKNTASSMCRKTNLHKVEWSGAQAAVEARDEDGKAIDTGRLVSCHHQPEEDGAGTYSSQRPCRRIQSLKVGLPG